MNFGKMREVFVPNMPRKKNLFTFYTGVMVLEKCQEYRCLRRIDAPAGSSVDRFDF